MILNYNTAPIKNEICKRCMHKPCRRLLAGRVFPGKLLFVHRRGFVSFPCRPEFTSETPQIIEPEVMTDEIEVIQGEIQIINPRWEHCDESKKMSSSAVHLGDKIMMIADFTNLPEGHSVSFDIYDMSEPGLRIDSVRSKNQNGSAKAEWTISDKTNNDLPPKLSFEVIARSKTSERVNIDLEELDEFNFSM